MFGKWMCHFFLWIFIFCFASNAKSQWGWNNSFKVKDEGVFMGGAGMAFIDGESYFSFGLRTEVGMGDWGLGLDIPLRFNTKNGELRSEDWDSSYDYFRVLRYIRYGKKHRSKIYSQLGTLDAAKLGHGFIMSYYTNEAQYDERKIGLAFDLKFSSWGMESVVSNFQNFEIVGGRLYVKPLLKMKSLFLLNKLTFGATFVTDRDPDGNSSSNDDVAVAGVDVGLPLLRFGSFYSSIYADHAQIINYGSGQAIGLELGLWKLGGLVTIQTKVERRFLGKNFLPSYFDPFYEVERFQPTGPTGLRKRDRLRTITSTQYGTYGELLGHVLGMIRLIGTFERIDKQAQSGRLHMGAMLSKPIGKISARGMYDKTNIDTFGDVFSLDTRSILRAGLGYQINSYLHLFTDYVWTFETNDAGKIESQRRIEPQLTFVMPF